MDVEDDDDEYEPDFYAAEDTEQILNKLDTSSADDSRELQRPELGSLTLPAFRLPPPPSLSPEQAAKVNVVFFSEGAYAVLYVYYRR